MANYAITTYTVTGDYATVAAALETKIETVTNTKVIRYWDILVIPKGGGAVCIGILQYDT